MVIVNSHCFCKYRYATPRYVQIRQCDYYIKSSNFNPLRKIQVRSQDQQIYTISEKGKECSRLTLSFESHLPNKTMLKLGLFYNIVIWFVIVKRFPRNKGPD